MIIGGSISGKINALLNLINQQPHIDKVFLYAKDTFEEKYQLLTKKEKNVDPKHCMILTLTLNTAVNTVLVLYLVFKPIYSLSNYLYGNIDEYSPNIRLHLIAFDCI